MNIASCNSHQHGKRQDVCIITILCPQFTGRLKEVESSSTPTLHPPSHRLGAPVLKHLHSINWPQLIAPEKVNQARLLGFFLQELWTRTSKRAFSVGRLLEWRSYKPRSSLWKNMFCYVHGKAGKDDQEKGKRIKRLHREKAKETTYLFLGPVSHEALLQVSLIWLIEIGVFLYLKKTCVYNQVMCTIILSCKSEPNLVV